MYPGRGGFVIKVMPGNLLQPTSRSRECQAPNARLQRIRSASPPSPLSHEPSGDTREA
jgi:hypothetical protein